MNAAALAALLLWVPIVLSLFALLPTRRALIANFVAGTLFLPVIDAQQVGLLFLSKGTVVSLSGLAGVLLFDLRSLLRYRWRWFDLPMAMFLVAPMLASLSNDLGWYDAAHALFVRVATWGVPYVLGRVFLADADGTRDLALGIYLGGLIYIPFCLYEIRMSPQLQSMIYGTGTWFGQRLGGWRPSVFLRDGLELGLWMTSASLTGLWLWRSGVLARLRRRMFDWLVWPLLAVTILCRSLGALLLLAMGWTALRLLQTFRLRWVLAGLAVIAPAYVGMRLGKLWTGESAVAIAQRVDPDRAQSLEFRLTNENILMEKALQRPVLGWGGWGRSRVYDEYGRDISITDGFWIIQLGWCGLFGLTAGYCVLLLPASLLTYRTAAAPVYSARVAPAVCLAVVVTLFAIDCLMNNAFNPVYILALGATAGFFGQAVPAVLRERIAAGSMAQNAQTVGVVRRMATGEPLPDRAGRGGPRQ